MFKAVLFVFYDKKTGKVLSERRRADNAFYPNKLTFPAGTLEKNESLEAALLREITEEFGVTPLKYESLSETPISGKDSAYLLYPYIITEWSGTMPTTILDKGNPTCWETLEEVAVSEVRTRPIIVEMIKKYLKDTHL